VIDEIAAHAREELPRECCGVLIGKGNEIVESVRTRNVSDDPNRYVLDPQDHIAARRAARSRGLAVVGFYHSHPHSEPVPSDSDLAEAHYVELLYVIVRPLPAAAKVRMFRFEEGGFEEQPFELA
jgi:proteasome lid subunit RPN8/RPN11